MFYSNTYYIYWILLYNSHLTSSVHVVFHNLLYIRYEGTGYVVTFDNCRQSGDWAAIGSVVTSLAAVVSSHYIVTVQSQCSDCAL